MKIPGNITRARHSELARRVTKTTRTSSSSKRENATHHLRKTTQKAHKHTSTRRSDETSAQATVSVTARLDEGEKLVAATGANSKNSVASSQPTSEAKKAVTPASITSVPFSDRTTLVVSPTFSFLPALANQALTLSLPTSSAILAAQAIPTTPALLSIPFLSIPTTNVLPSLRSTSSALSLQSSGTFPSNAIASAALPTSSLASNSTMTSHETIASSQSSSAARSQGPPTALIGGLVASCVLLFVIAPCLVCRFLKFRRNRALVSPADFSPGVGGSKSFGSPIWGPALEETLSSDSIEDEKNVATLFPNPPRPFAKHKLHPDIRMHIGKPQPMVLPDFVSASYGNEIEQQDYLKNSQIFERGGPKGLREMEAAARDQELPQQPQVRVTGPTPSTSAGSDATDDQPQPVERDETPRQVPRKLEHEERTFSYVNFEDHLPSVSD